MFYRTPTWTILGSLTRLFQPLMFADGDGGGDGGGDGASGGDGSSGAAGGDGGSSGGDGGVGAGGGQVSNWRDSLPDDIKAHATLEKFNSVADLAKSHLEVQKLIGRKGIIPPAEGASEEEIGKFYNELGRPEKVEDYKLEDVKLPEGVNIDDNLKTDFLNVAHKVGLLPHQVNALRAWQIENMGNAVKLSDENHNKEVDAAETKLRQEWGNAYDAKVALGKKVVNKYNAKEAFGDDLDKNPRVIKLLADIGGDLGEDTLGEGTAIMVKTPDDAQKEISLIRNNPKHPYHIPGHVEHQAALKQMNDLYKMGYPDKKE